LVFFGNILLPFLAIITPKLTHYLLKLIHFMFIEPTHNTEKTGWIEVVCGSMFSGKTEELIRRLKRAKIANKNIKAFKPKIDNRYHETEIMSHDENSVHSIPVSHSSEILKAIDSTTEVVAIDEAQFFDTQLPDVCNEIALKGIRVIIAGLDMDYLGNPFGPMPQLLAIAEYVTKLHAICMVCGGTAQLSFRIEKNTADQVLVGAKDMYEARCRKCFHAI
jgi:thymidine kinase